MRREPIEARRDSAFYVLRRNLYRHRWAVGIGVAVLGAVLGTALALSARSRAEAERLRAEAARMRSALSLARTWTRDTAPVAASASLWREFLNRDSNRTRFALWEFYLRYPRVYVNSDFKRQVDVEFSPSGNWLATVTEDGRLVVYDACKIYDAGDDVVVPTTVKLEAPAKVIKFAPKRPYRLYVGDAWGRVCARSFDDDTGHIGNPDPLLKLEGTPPSDTQSGPATCLAVSACGTWLAVGSAETPLPERKHEFRDGRIRVWKLPETAPVYDVTIPCRRVTSIAFSPKAAHMAIGLRLASPPWYAAPPRGDQRRPLWVVLPLLPRAHTRQIDVTDALELNMDEDRVSASWHNHPQREIDPTVGMSAHRQFEPCKRTVVGQLIIRLV